MARILLPILGASRGDRDRRSHLLAFNQIGFGPLQDEVRAESRSDAHLNRSQVRNCAVLKCFACSVLSSIGPLPRVRSTIWGVDSQGLPGAAKFAAASSMTNTQSPESGAVKSLFPAVANVPAKVAAPDEGLNHQHVACRMPLVILDMSTVKVARFPLGTYAIIVCPSQVREVTVRFLPEPKPAITAVWPTSATNLQCSRLRKSWPKRC